MGEHALCRNVVEDPVEVTNERSRCTSFIKCTLEKVIYLIKNENGSNSTVTNIHTENKTFWGKLIKNGVSA